MTAREVLALIGDLCDRLGIDRTELTVVYLGARVHIDLTTTSGAVWDTFIRLYGADIVDRHATAHVGDRAVVTLALRAGDRVGAL